MNEEIDPQLAKDIKRHNLGEEFKTPIYNDPDIRDIIISEFTGDKNLNVLEATKHISATDQTHYQTYDGTYYGLDGYTMGLSENAINETSKDILEKIKEIDYQGIVNEYKVNGEDSTLLDQMLDGILKGVQITIPEAKGKGVIGVISEADGAYIFGGYTSSGYYRDSKGKTISATNTSFSLKSNIEVNVGTRIIIYPFMDKVDDLTGFGLTLGGEYSPKEIVGGAIDITNVNPKILAISIQVAPPTPSTLPADLYINVGYTEKVVFRKLSLKEFERLNSLKLGGY